MPAFSMPSSFKGTPPTDEGRLHGKTCADGGVFETALAVIPVQNVSVVGEVRLEDIQVAVQVIIADSHAHAGLLHAILVQGHAALQADIGESAIAFVAHQETGCGVTSHVDVRPAVVIEIRGHGSHGVTFKLEYPALRAHIGKGAVAVVVVES